MSARSRRLRDLFLEPPAVHPPAAPASALAPERLAAPAADEAPAVDATVAADPSAASAGRRLRADDDPPVDPSVVPGTGHRSAAQGWAAPAGRRPPAVAVLAPRERVVAATAAIAVALGRAHRTPWTLAAVLGAGAPGDGSALALPAARRAAGRLRRDGHGAVAAGRIVWLAPAPHDLGAAAAGTAEPVASTGTPGVPGPSAAVRGMEAATTAAAVVARSTAGMARRLGASAVLGVAVARSGALDRALTRYDAIVVVQEPDAATALTDLVLASLAQLDRPVTAMPPLGRLAAALARSGLVAAGRSGHAVAATAGPSAAAARRSVAARAGGARADGDRADGARADWVRAVTARADGDRADGAGA